MHFQITQSDYDSGTRKSPCACPVVRCIMRHLTPCSVSVRPDFIFINGKHYQTPEIVFEWIDAYDDGQDPALIEFELPVEVQQ